MKKRIHLTENQLYRLIGRSLNETRQYSRNRNSLSRRVAESVIRNIRESVDSDDALYQYIAQRLKKDLDDAIIEYVDSYHHLYDKIKVPTYIKYKPDANTFIFGTIYSWFEHEYDSLIGCGVDTSMLVICHVDDNMRAVDKPQPFPIDLNRLNQLIGAFDSETEEEKEYINTGSF